MSERVNALDPQAELFYRRLMSVVDDYGRIEDNPKLLLVKCFPLQIDRISPTQVSAWLTACGLGSDTCRPLITRYQVNGKNYLQINNFGQRTRFEKYPAPSQDSVPPSQAARASHSRSTVFPVLEVLSEPVLEVLTTRAMQIVPDAAVVESEFQLLATIFLGLGAALSETDMRKCAMLWVSLDVASQLGALDYARMQRDSEWHKCELRYVPRLWNYLEERHWERRAVVDGRKRAMTKGEETNERVARRFMASERTK